MLRNKRKLWFWRRAKAMAIDNLLWATYMLFRLQILCCVGKGRNDTDKYAYRGWVDREEWRAKGTWEEREGLLRQADLDVAVEQLYCATSVNCRLPIHIANHWVLDHTVVSRRDCYHPLRPKNHAIYQRNGATVNSLNIVQFCIFNLTKSTEDYRSWSCRMNVFGPSSTRVTLVFWSSTWR